MMADLNASSSSISFLLRPQSNVFSELLKLQIATNNQVILKLKNNSSDSNPDVELISLGPIGSSFRLSGVRAWHRIPSFKNLEWFNVNFRNCLDEIVWLEISDAQRLVNIISSLQSFSSSVFMDDASDTNEYSSSLECVEITISEQELRIQAASKGIFTLPVRWFDSRWAATTIVLPPTSPPQISLKLVAGLDQLAAILKRIDRWRNHSWDVDRLTIKAEASSQHDDRLWNIGFIAETSHPPIVKLSAILQNCPLFPAARSSPFPSEISVDLGAAARALIAPLAANAKLECSPNAVVISIVPEEALICHINWAAVGMGPMATTIFIPARL